MEATVLANDKEFLEQTLMFYRNINKYAALLEVNQMELDSFINDVKILLYVADRRYRSFTESFVRYNIAILRTRLESLFIACARSKNYSKKIGAELGMVMNGHLGISHLGPDDMKAAVNPASNN